MGNRYILVMVDQFTRWVEVAPIAEQTAEVTAQKLLQEFLSRFGVPLEIHTDQGRNFESALFHELCTLLQVAKTRTTPYHPASNGQVERFNRTLLQMVRCYVGKHQNEWDQHLHLLAAAYRSSPNACTGFTPNRMMLGREVHQPQGLALRVKEANVHRVSPSEYVADLEAGLQEVHEVARHHLRASQLRSKRGHDLRARQRTYHPGDLVYVRDDARKKGQSPKLQPRWRGPALVTEKMGHVLYRVQEGRKERVLHHDRLLPYLADAVPIWIQRKRHALLQEQVPAEASVDSLEGDRLATGTEEEQEGRSEEEVTGQDEEEGIGSGEGDPPLGSEEDPELGLADLFRDDREASTSGPPAQVQMVQHQATSHPSSESTIAHRRSTQARAPGGQSDDVDPEGAEADDSEPSLPCTQRGRVVRRPARFRH